MGSRKIKEGDGKEEFGIGFEVVCGQNNIRKF
jgi:hypothetical protein